MNTYTHLGLEDALDEMIQMEELNAARGIEQSYSLETGEKITTSNESK